MDLTSLGFYFNINELFIKSKGIMLGTFIPTIIIIRALSIMLCFLIFKSGDDYETM